MRNAGIAHFSKSAVPAVIVWAKTSNGASSTRPGDRGMDLHHEIQRHCCGRWAASVGPTAMSASSAAAIKTPRRVPV